MCRRREADITNRQNVMVRLVILLISYESAKRWLLFFQRYLHEAEPALNDVVDTEHDRFARILLYVLGQELCLCWLVDDEV